MHGLINQFINNYPALASLIVILVTIFLGFIGSLYLYFLFTEKEPILTKTKLGDIIYVALMLGFVLIISVTGVFYESILKIYSFLEIENFKTARYISLLFLFLAAAVLIYWLYLIYSSLEQQKKSRFINVMIFIWIFITLVYSYDADRYFREDFFMLVGILNLPLIIYWLVRYIVGPKKNKKHTKTKKHNKIKLVSVIVICLSLFFLSGFFWKKYKSLKPIITYDTFNQIMHVYDPATGISTCNGLACK